MPLAGGDVDADDVRAGGDMEASGLAGVVVLEDPVEASSEHDHGFAGFMVPVDRHHGARFECVENPLGIVVLTISQIITLPQPRIRLGLS